jgi:hypothetical protein
MLMAIVWTDPGLIGGDDDGAGEAVVHRSMPRTN